MKIFVVLSRIPYPLEKGDKLRAYNQLKCLARNHEIYLFAVNDTEPHHEAYNELMSFCKEVHFFQLSKFGILLNVLKAFLQGKPLQVGYFFNCKAKKEIDKLVARINPDHIFCQLVRVSEYVKNINCKKTIDYQDAFSKGVERRITKAPFFMKPVFRMEYRRLMKYETEIFDSFTHKTIISEQDRLLINHSRNNEIEIIPNGVDFEYFSPAMKEKTFDLVFTGNMNYPPNIDGAEYIVNKILPLFQRKNGKLRVLIAGATPHFRVKSLAADNVVVTGWVDDIRECYSDSKIFIAPMQIGIGLQNKLLEAMAMGLPCITSNLANNALKAKHGVEILVGDSPEDYAEHIMALLENKEFSKSIAENGRKFVSSQYNWQSNTKGLEELMLKQN